MALEKTWHQKSKLHEIFQNDIFLITICIILFWADCILHYNSDTKILRVDQFGWNFFNTSYACTNPQPTTHPLPRSFIHTHHICCYCFCFFSCFYYFNFCFSFTLPACTRQKSIPFRVGSREFWRSKLCRRDLIWSHSGRCNGSGSQHMCNRLLMPSFTNGGSSGRCPESTRS